MFKNTTLRAFDDCSDDVRQIIQDSARLLRPRQEYARLTSLDEASIVAHLCELSEDDLRLRFSRVMTRELIVEYAKGINFNRDIVLGVRYSGKIIALCHMAVYNEHGHAVGELGVSIKEAFRVNGIGSRLLGLCFFEAQERQISHLYIIYARHNKPMAALCRKFGATLRDDEGEVTASMVVHGKREAEKVVERFIGHGLEVMEKIPACPKGTVILVHGAGGDSWQWRQHFIPYLAEKGYRAMAVSLNSHGRSKSAHNETIDSYIDDVKTLLDEVDCENTILVGHSLGGFVIQKVLEERSVAKAFLLSTIPPGGLDGEQLDNAKKALKHYCGREVLDGAMREFDPIDVSKITTPIVVVGGRFDRVIPMALVEMTAEQFKTTARVMENSGHALMLSPDWEKVAEMIAS